MKRVRTRTRTHLL